MFLLKGVCSAVYISVNICMHVADMKNALMYKGTPVHGCMDM